MNPYYFKMTPPFKFSLADLAKNKKPAEAPSVVTTEVEKLFSLAQLVKKKPELKPEIEQLA
jgi:hypothetical protein